MTPKSFRMSQLALILSSMTSVEDFKLL